MQILPAPIGRRVDAILHLADLHIRKGNENKSRYREYRRVIQGYLSDVARHPAVVANTAIACILGDVFHDKGAIHGPGKTLFDLLIDGLSALMPTFVIAGNHDLDMRVANDGLEDDADDADDAGDVEDMLRAMMRGKANAAYLDRTGHYRCANLGIGVVAQQDVLTRGASSGLRAPELRPAFPSATAFDAEADIDFRCALFHGSVVGSRMPGGLAVCPESVDDADHHEHEHEQGDDELMALHALCEMPTTWMSRMSGVSLAYFGEGYDALLLGDIHLPQMHHMTALPASDPGWSTTTSRLCPPSSFNVADGRLPFAYSGSLVQQDFGEPILGHGGLVWSLPQRQVRHLHVANRRGLVKVRHAGDAWAVCLSTDDRRGGGPDWRPLEDAVRHAWFPRDVDVHVMGCGVGPRRAVDVASARDALRALGVKVRHTQAMMMRDDCPAAGGRARTAAAGRALEDDVQDLASCDLPASAIQYIASLPTDARPTGDEWQAWIRDPTLLQVPQDPGACGAIVAKVDALNAHILTLCLPATAPPPRTSPFKLVSAWWSWIGAFGPDNWFDAEGADGKIVLLSGPNGSGKTTMTQVVFQGIFSVPLPSRKNGSYSSAIVSNHAPKVPRPRCRQKTDRTGRIAVVLDVDGVRFRITRALVAQDEGGVTVLDTGDSSLSRLLPDGQDDRTFPTLRLVKDIKAWVDANVGTAASFLSCTLLSQGSDESFIEAKDDVQIATICNAIGFRATLARAAAFRRALLDHDAVGDLAETAQAHALAALTSRPITPCAAVPTGASVPTGETRDGVAAHIRDMEEACHVCRDAWSSCGSRQSYDADAADEAVGDVETLRLLVADLRARRHPGVPVPGVPTRAPTVAETEEMAGLSATVATMGARTLSDDGASRMREGLRTWSDAWRRAGYDWTLDASPVVPLVRGEALEAEHVRDARLVDDAAAACAHVAADRAMSIAEARLCLWRSSPAPPSPVTFLDDAAMRGAHARLVHLEARLTPGVDRASVDRLEALCGRATTAHVSATHCLELARAARPVAPDRDAVEGHRRWLEVRVTLMTTRLATILEHAPTCDTAVQSVDAVEAVERTAQSRKAVLVAHEVAIAAARTDRDRAASELAEAKCTKHPYDASCAACRQQHWKLSEIRLEERASSANRRLVRAEAAGRAAALSLDPHDLAHGVAILDARLSACRKWLTDHEASVERGAYWLAELEAHDRMEAWTAREAVALAAAEGSGTALALRSSEHGVAATALALLETRDELTLSIARDVQRQAGHAAWRGEGDALAAASCTCSDVCVVTGAEAGRAKRGLAEAGAACEAALRRVGDAERFVAEATPYRRDSATLAADDASLPARARHAELVHADAAHRLEVAERDLETAVRLHRRATVGASAYAEWTRLRAELVPAHAELQRQSECLGASALARAEDARAEAQVHRLREYGARLHERKRDMKLVADALASYRAWVLSHRVTLLLEREVNEILDEMQDGADRRIRLDVRWKRDAPAAAKNDRTSCGKFDWHYHNGEDNHPFNLASGFQKSAIGLAMRIALARIGGAGVASRTIIVDEGFRDCDADNLARVPAFLRRLLTSGTFDNIVLISHIADIKSCATVRVPIVLSAPREGIQLSRVQFGRRPRSDM